MPIMYHLDIDPTAGTAKLKLSSEGLQDLLYDLGADALTLWQGTDKVLVLAPGGGHWETSAPGDLTAKPGGVEIEAGHLQVHNL